MRLFCFCAPSANFFWAFQVEGQGCAAGLGWWVGICRRRYEKYKFCTPFGKYHCTFSRQTSVLCRQTDARTRKFAVGDTKNTTKKNLRPPPNGDERKQDVSKKPRVYYYRTTINWRPAIYLPLLSCTLYWPTGS